MRPHVLMKLDLPRWAQSPLVVIPYFGISIAVPLLVGMSDRAAEFAGSLFAALAAVAAVLLGGVIQRSNDHARESREHARRMIRYVRTMDGKISRWRTWSAMAGVTAKLFRGPVNALRADHIYAAVAGEDLKVSAEMEMIAAQISDELPEMLRSYDAMRHSIEVNLRTKDGPLSDSISDFVALCFEAMVADLDKAAHHLAHVRAQFHAALED